MELFDTDAAWSGSYAPAQVVTTVLGQSEGHPATLTDVTSAWNVAAYVWTLSMTAATFQQGKAEANQAADLLKKGGLASSIIKSNEIAKLQDANWVTQPTKSDLVKLITNVAVGEYSALNAEYQQALSDYTYASHFQLPTGW